MKIVQTFWSGIMDSDKLFHIKGGWGFPEYHWMSWALSAKLLRRHYSELELYTDEIGKRILVDLLKLPYTKVHIVFDENFNIDPNLFALAKIETYSLQQEPFVHIDGDLFLWKPLPERVMDAELISSNLEIDLFFNKEILESMEEHFQYIPKHLKNIHNQEHIYASNAGILGGSNIPFVRKYCAMARKIIKENENSLKKVNVGLINVLIEQISLYYLAAQEGIETKYFVPEPVGHPLYQDYWRFADIPHVPMIHPVGGCKRIPYVLHHLAHRLQMEFPTTYYRILKYCTDENIPLRNRLYTYLNLEQSDDGTKLRKHSFFKTAVNFSGLETLVSDTAACYDRTLHIIAHYYPDKKIEPKELAQFVKQKSTNNQVKEVFLLETQKLKCFEQLYLTVKKGEIYNAELVHYKNTTALTIAADWIQKKAMLKEGVLLLKMSKPWGLLNTQEPEEAWAKVLEMPETAYCLTLGMDLLTFNTQETYYDELDATIIQLLGRPMSLENMLKSLTAYFGDYITSHDTQY